MLNIYVAIAEKGLQELQLLEDLSQVFVVEKVKLKMDGLSHIHGLLVEDFSKLFH